MREEFKSLLDAYKKARNEEIGLYQIIHNIKKATYVEDKQELMGLTLSFVAIMLSNGFEVIDLQRSSPLCKPWKNQNIDYVINRIKTEWATLGREPNIGDIAWFLLKE